MARPRRESSRKNGSPRALGLGIVLFVLAITLAPPAQRYFSQRSQINALRAQVSTSQEALTEASRQLQLWRDPDYVQSQARERLHFVLPGERQYILTDIDPSASSKTQIAIAKDITAGLSWYNRLIASITEAGSL